MSLSKSSKHSGRHLCSHEHIHDHNENHNSSNIRKPSEQSRSQQQIPPKPPRYNSEKPFLAEHALEQELEYYKSELARAEQKEQRSARQQGETNEGQIKAELHTITRAHNKVKKEYTNLQKEHEAMIKKLNDLENRVTKGDREIQSLKTIRSSKGEAKKETKKSPVKQSNPQIQPIKNYNHTTSMDNLMGSNFNFKQLQEENRTLKERLRLFEQAHNNNNSQFQPILQQNTRQIRQLITEKNRYISQNSQLKQKLEQLQSQSSHFQQKHNSLSTSFQKMKNQYERMSLQHSKNTQQAPTHATNSGEVNRLKDQLKQAQSRINQLNSKVQNQSSHISHLENTNRYLVGENKKLLSIHKGTVPQLTSQNQRPVSAQHVFN